MICYSRRRKLVQWRYDKDRWFWAAPGQAVLGEEEGAAVVREVMVTELAAVETHLGGAQSLPGLFLWLMTVSFA